MRVQGKAECQIEYFNLYFDWCTVHFPHNPSNRVVPMFRSWKKLRALSFAMMLNTFTVVFPKLFSVPSCPVDEEIPFSNLKATVLNMLKIK